MHVRRRTVHGRRVLLPALINSSDVASLSRIASRWTETRKRDLKSVSPSGACGFESPGIRSRTLVA
jgi:hypothetical protein